MKPFIKISIAAWFGLVLLLAADGKFVASQGRPPFPIIVGFSAPLILFAVAWLASASFRNYILAADPRFLVAIQGWRSGGLGFLALYAHHILPGLFAWPAGLGDIAVGVTAPWILIALLRDPTFAASPRFVLWNLFGILDLVVAITLGGLNSGFLPAVADKITTGPMAELPLVLVPAFLVPIFIMIHITLLIQARRSVRSRPPV